MKYRRNANFASSWQISRQASAVAHPGDRMQPASFDEIRTCADTRRFSAVERLTGWGVYCEGFRPAEAGVVRGSTFLLSDVAPACSEKCAGHMRCLRRVPLCAYLQDGFSCASQSASDRSLCRAGNRHRMLRTPKSQNTSGRVAEAFPMHRASSLYGRPGPQQGAWMCDVQSHAVPRSIPFVRPSCFGVAVPVPPVFLSAMVAALQVAVACDATVGGGQRRFAGQAGDPLRSSADRALPAVGVLSEKVRLNVFRRAGRGRLRGRFALRLRESRASSDGSVTANRRFTLRAQARKTG